jgi:hypothetical protein
MSSKSEWTAVHERMMEEQRQRLGPPPTAEELEAYENGTLPAEEEERVRALLVCYPALARTLVRRPEPETPQPGDGDYLSKDEVTKDWQSLRKRIRRGDGGGRVLRFWRFSAAIAAALAVVFGGLLWRARSELGQPHVANEYVLTSDVARGGTDLRAEVKLDGHDVLLTMVHDGTPGPFRVDIVRTASKPGRTLWSGRPRVRPDDRYVMVVVPNRFLEPGRYELVLFGLRDGREEKLAVYPFRVVR